MFLNALNTHKALFHISCQAVIQKSFVKLVNSSIYYIMFFIWLMCLNLCFQMLEFHKHVMRKREIVLSFNPLPNSTEWCVDVYFMNVSRTPVAQSVATPAVNPGVMSSNPSSANILSDVWQKSLWHASCVYPQWANSLCGKAASCLESMLHGVLVWENQETYE